MQKQRRMIESQAGVIGEQQQLIAAFARRLDRIEQEPAAPTGTER